MPIAINVNDKSHVIYAEPSTPLLYILRNELALHGPRFGCGPGQRGACTVHVDGRPMFSCILPLAAVGERKITTLEGLLEDGKPNKLQQARMVGGPRRARDRDDLVEIRDLARPR
jgi:nicotinate dehydrogenase subunit A